MWHGCGAASRGLSCRVQLSRLKSDEPVLSILVYPRWTQMTLTEAFAEYGAKLRNPQWSMAAQALNGALVVSLYANWFRKGEQPRTLTYSDAFSNWKGNELGRNEFKRLLHDTAARNAPIYIVLAHPDPSQAHLVGAIQDESVIKKTFSIRQDWIGAVEHFDGDSYRIVIRET